MFLYKSPAFLKTTAVFKLSLMVTLGQRPQGVCKIYEISTDQLFLDHSKFFADARETVTHCGLACDQWLSEPEKPAVVIVDTRWGDQGAAEEFQKFASHPAVRERELSKAVAKKYPDIRVFQTRLYQHASS